ncbi:MAG: porin [Burkholderiales bacterium]|nr:porin [Burkholderiales bacterium]
MKRSLIALAALAVVSAASAQSSVTIFGVVDATVAIGNGDTSNKTQLTNSGYNSSRLGFRGVEDLGGGLKAKFWLEAGVMNDNGAGAATNVNNQGAGGALAGMNGSQGLTFNRSSWVSVEGSMGEIRLGRDYTPQFWSFTVYDPFGTNGVGTTQALNSSAGGVTIVRASNSLAWKSPSYSGFGIWAQTYFGENASSAASQAGDGSAIRVSYDQGPLSLAFAVSKTTTGAGTDVTSTNVAGSYNMGVAQLMAFWNKDENTGAKDVTGYTIGALVPVAPAGTVRVSFSNSDNGNGAKTDKFALGYVHDLSKRTALYGTFASLSNSGGAAQALNGAATPANGSSTGFDIGVRHAF